MHTVTSADGTTIAYDTSGDGPPVLLVGGAVGSRPREAGLAALLAPSLAGVNYDRRGRGDSGDAPGYAVEREVEDLAALVDALGGSAYAYGTSSGGTLVLEAALQGVPFTKVALWEPILEANGRRPVPEEYVAHVRELVASGRRGDAVEYFMTTAAGLPPEFVAPMRQMPMWPGMEAIAHTIAYDGILVEGFSATDERLRSLDVPALVLDGGQVPHLTGGADALAETLPDSRRQTLDGQPHNVADEAMAPALVAFFAR